MNIKKQNYLRVSKALKQPKKYLSEQTGKLVYTYPFLVADSVSQDNATIARDFFSLTMLKELFLSNSLDIISIASDVQSLTDESGESIDAYGGGYLSSQTPKQRALESQRSQIQDKVKKRTAVIKRLLNSDPSYKKLRPYVEVISLSNLMDVPIIVGTKMFPLDTSSLFLILMMSVLDNNTNLNFQNKTDVSKLFKFLDGLSEDQLAHLINGSVPVQSDPGIFKRVLSFMKSKIKKGARSRPVSRTTPSGPEMSPISSELSSGIINSVQSNLNKTELFFSLATDPQMFYSQTGVSMQYNGFDDNDDKSNLNYLSYDRKAFEDVCKMRFSRLFARHGSAFFRVMISTLYTFDSSQVNTLTDAIQEEIVSDFNENTTQFIDWVVPAFSSKAPDRSFENAKKVSTWCNDEFKDLDKKLKKQFPDGVDSSTAVYTLTSNDGEFIQDKQGNPSEQYTDEVYDLLNKVDHVNDAFASYVDQIKRLFAQVLENNEVQDMDKSITKQATKAVNSIKSKLQQNETSPWIPRTDIGQLPNDINKLLVNMIKVCWYWGLQKSFCDFVSSNKVDFEISKNSVTDLPNYALVFPVELIYSIANAVVAKDYKELVNLGKARASDVPSRLNNTYDLMQSIRANYTERVIKMLNGRFQIPNLIVVDENKNMMYYQFMHHNKPNKIKINQAQQFVKELTSNPLSQEVNDNFDYQVY